MSDTPWVTTTEFALDRHERAFEATIPVAIETQTPALSTLALAAADDATVAAARFDVLLRERFGDAVVHVSALLARVEALASSGIENIHTDALHVAQSAVKPRSVDEQARLAHANIEATSTACHRLRDATTPITPADLLDIHHRLLGDHAPHLTGSWRESVVWIGGPFSSPGTAAYVAPLPARVPELIDDLCSFINRTDMPVLAHAAIAHAQYETIHPHGDGNGRTGRALVHGLLRRGGITQDAVVPFSTGLRRHVRDYYDSLRAYRSGDLDVVVEVFAHAVAAATEQATALVGDIEEMLARWHGNVRARNDAVVWPALPWLLAQPVITVGALAEQFDVTYPAAQRAVETLEAAEIVVPLNDQRRGRTWIVSDVVALRATR